MKNGHAKKTQICADNDFVDMRWGAWNSDWLRVKKRSVKQHQESRGEHGCRHVPTGHSTVVARNQ